MDQILLFLILAAQAKSPLIAGVAFGQVAVTFISTVLGTWVLMTKHINKRIKDKVSSEIYEKDQIAVNESLKKLDSEKLDEKLYITKITSLDIEIRDIKLANIRSNQDTQDSNKNTLQSIQDLSNNIMKIVIEGKKIG